ncbi:Tetratricopeptide domain protein [Nitrosococcus halophilus Nc 4]|uniref:protein O-GlcNAc transferase n=1 Tax=Nitrosococcus halophilus (strain Nc4) TaxID=472759 RepID=D5C289_NITHN|nr:tetratricopeptide repeat protein [Nitrosococcus halophilus]ADE16677.1 Tetratricopeptide domain protein [Nitrosococcus halophilus Nc 4]
MGIEERLARARRLQARNRFHESAQLYTQILAKHPNHPDALLGLGNAALQNRDFNGAVQWLERLLKVVGPKKQLLTTLSTAHSNCGSRLFETAALPSALTHFQRALELNSHNTLAWRNLALTQLQLGESQAAVVSARQAALLDLRDHEAHLLLARALLANHQYPAGLGLLRILSNLPLPDELAIGVAEQWLLCHQPDPAWALLERQRSRSMDPSALASRIMSLARRHGENWQAAQWLRRWLKQNRANEKQSLDFARTLARAGEAHKAVIVYQKVLATHPNSWPAKLGATLTLPVVYEDARHLARVRDRFAKSLETLKNWQPTTPPLLEDLLWSNFLLAYQGLDDLSLQRDYGDWLHHWASRAQDSPPQIEPGRLRPRRIGFVSSSFRNCTVGHYFGRWPGALRQGGFEVRVYQLGPHRDHHTQTIANSASKFCYLNRDLASCATQIAEDQLDALIYPELGMDARVLVLAALRLAPFQGCAWGHPITSGLPTMDVYFSCAPMEPPEGRNHYRERLALLPGLGTSYPAPPQPPAASRGELGLPENRTLYLLPQSPFKIHPDTDALVARVLAEDTQGVLILFAGQDRRVTDKLLSRLRAALAQAGADPKRQLLLLPVMTRSRYLQINRCCDLMLDPPHWSGGNTALDALSTGLPIMTLPSAYMRGRQSAAMLTLLELPELIALDREGYVTQALQYGRNKAANETLRGQILTRQKRLFEQKEPMKALTSFFHGLK